MFMRKAHGLRGGGYLGGYCRSYGLDCRCWRTPEGLDGDLIQVSSSADPQPVRTLYVLRAPRAATGAGPRPRAWRPTDDPAIPNLPRFSSAGRAGKSHSRTTVIDCAG